MVHLADPDAQERIYRLPEGQEFIAFVDQFPITMDAKISFLVKNVEGKITLLTCSYKRPYEKKNFIDETNWPDAEYHDVHARNEVKGHLESARKVLLVKRVHSESDSNSNSDSDNEKDSVQIKYGLIIQTN